MSKQHCIEFFKVASRVLGCYQRLAGKVQQKASFYQKFRSKVLTCPGSFASSLPLAASSAWTLLLVFALLRPKIENCLDLKKSTRGYFGEIK